MLTLCSCEFSLCVCFILFTDPKWRVLCAHGTGSQTWLTALWVRVHTEYVWGGLLWLQLHHGSFRNSRLNNKVLDKYNSHCSCTTSFKSGDMSTSNNLLQSVLSNWTSVTNRISQFTSGLVLQTFVRGGGYRVAHTYILLQPRKLNSASNHIWWMNENENRNKKKWTFRFQFQIFRKLSQDPVATAMPSSVTPRQLTRLSCPANTPRRTPSKHVRVHDWWRKTKEKTYY